MSLLGLEASIAIRYLSAKKREGFISVISILSLLGITIGVGALIVVMAVMNGYRIELTEKLKGFNSDVTITGGKYKLKNYNAIAKKLEKEGRIRKVVPAINEQSLIVHGDSSLGVMVKGISKADVAAYPFLMSGPQSSKKYSGIVIGHILARSMGIRVGDIVRLVSPKFNPSLTGDMPKMQKFYVEGLFRSGLSEYDGAYVFMNLLEAQKLFDLPKAVSRLEVFANSDIDSKLLSKKISEILEYNYQVLDWQMMNSNILNALKTERVVMFIILTFIIVVAAFNIISSLVMLVTDKTKEIAIMRAVGFSQGAIMRIFLMSGLLLGIIGTALGVGWGALFASHINSIKEFLSSISGITLFDPIIYYLEVLPAKMDKKDVFDIVLLSLGLSFASALYPAYKASRLSPAQGLKND